MSRKGLGGRQLSWAAETWEDYVNVCVGACKRAPFPTLSNRILDSFTGASLQVPKEASHQRLHLGSYSL